MKTVNPELLAAIVSAPGYLARPKVRELGADCVAAIVAQVAAEPYEPRQPLDMRHARTCAVCAKTKDSMYFGERRGLAIGPYPVCRYCRHEIKAKVDVEYRSRKGLPPQRTPVIPEQMSQLSSDLVAELDAFVASREASRPVAARIQLPARPLGLGWLLWPQFWRHIVSPRGPRRARAIATATYRGDMARQR